MKKLSTPTREALSTGFSLPLIATDTWLLLPGALAAERTKELAEAAKRAAQASLQQDIAQVKDVSKKEPRQAHLDASSRAAPVFPSGTKRFDVLPDFDQLAKEAGETNPLPKSGDVDINHRRRRILEKLVALGPYRVVGGNPHWREALDYLEDLMPNFRAPIRLVRNTLALSDANGQPARIPPSLLLGPPGVGKTFFSRKLAELLGTSYQTVSYDQPSGGSALRGLDRHYGNTEPGLLFNLIALGVHANPVVLLDEIDKSATGSSTGHAKPLAELLGVLERETAKRMIDASLEIKVDTSLATYIATANSVRDIEAPLLSRMETFDIKAPARSEAAQISGAIARSVLERLNLRGKVKFSPQALHLLSMLSPRRMERAAEQAAGAAVADERDLIGESEMWLEIAGGDSPRLH